MHVWYPSPVVAFNPEGISKAIVVFFVSNGRLAGVSGIVNNALTKTHDRTINCLFLLGLILGPIIYMFFYQITLIFDMTSSMPIIIFGGLMVGFGTKIGCGCTSGHGVCGIEGHGPEPGRGCGG